MPRHGPLVPLLALLLLTAAGRIDAQEGPSLSVDPASQTVGLEEDTFEVRVLVNEVTTAQGLGGYTLVMNYDRAVIRALTIADSGFVASTENVVLCPASAIDNDAGRLAHFCFTVPLFSEPGPQVTEPQVLARVTFEPVSAGTTTLEIGETAIIDPEGNDLEAVTVDGAVTVQSGSPAQPAPPTPEEEGESDGGQNVGLYVGLGVAGLAILALLVAALAFRRRRRAGSS